MKKEKDDLQKDEDGRPLKMAQKLGSKVSEEDVKNMEEKLPSMKKGPILKIWDKVMDIYKGYKSESTPTYLKVLLVGSLIYLILPFDVVPDMIPIMGYTDDIGVLTFAWKKLSQISKIGKVITINSSAVSLNDKVQKRIKDSYDKLFKIAQSKLEKSIKEKGRNSIYNSLISLGLFITAIVLISSEFESNILIASILIVYLIIRSFIRFVIVLPNTIKFVKYYLKERNIDGAISLYLKDTYNFITPLEDLKNKIKILDDIPDLEIIVKMQRQSLLKTIILVVITVSIVMILCLLLRHGLMMRTSYSISSLVALPFEHFYNLIIG